MSSTLIKFLCWVTVCAKTMAVGSNGGRNKNTDSFAGFNERALLILRLPFVPLFLIMIRAGALSPTTFYFRIFVMCVRL